MQNRLLAFISLVALAISVSAQTNDAQKIDEFETYQCEDLLARLDYFSTVISQNTDLIGVVIVYEGKYPKFVYDKPSDQEKVKYVLPTFGESAFRSQIMQSYLSINKGIPKNRLIFVSGGYRDKHKIEFWTISKGANLPKASPTLNKIKYRKGKLTLVDCRIG